MDAENIGKGSKKKFRAAAKAAARKNIGSRKPNEIIRIPIDALESIYNFYKISGAESFGKYANWS